MHRKIWNISKKYLTIPIIVTVSFSVFVLSYITMVLVSQPYERKEPSDTTVDILPKTGQEYRVFVSSETYTGNLGNLDGADELCNTLAHNASGGSLGSNWAAWLSTSNVNAIERIPNVEYYLADETTLVINGKQDITGDGELQHAIDMDQNGSSAGINDEESVQTGTYNDGESGDVSDATCNNWRSASGYGRLEGIADSLTEWSYSLEDLGCDDEMRIYCFEVDKDEDEYDADGDCDDFNEDTYPGAAEVCDGLDNNCDGSTPSNENDNDNDGFRVCEGDCNDSDQLIYPGASERCNGIDDNCDGVVPQGEKDQDGDGYRGCEGDCKDKDASVYPGAIEKCDGKDNDCDGRKDENLNKPCGTNVGICTVGFETCTNGQWGNCSGVLPQTETCDGLDNDCDNYIDEGCSCDNGTTQPCGTDTGVCTKGTQWCENGVWGGCQGAVGPSTEICDGQDNDCDGSVDENLTKSCGTDVGECKTGTATCKNGVWEGCDGAVNPKEEKCDEKDNDCDGTTDEGCKCSTGKERSCGLSSGTCENGVQRCVEGKWSECEGGVLPTDEVCDDQDNDCDGEVDEDMVCEEEAAAEEGKNEEQVESDPGEGIKTFVNRMGQWAKDAFSSLFSIQAIPILIAVGLSGAIVVFVYNKYKVARKEEAAKRFKQSKGYSKQKVEDPAARRSPLS